MENFPSIRAAYINGHHLQYLHIALRAEGRYFLLGCDRFVIDFESTEDNLVLYGNGLPRDKLIGLLWVYLLEKALDFPFIVLTVFFLQVHHFSSDGHQMLDDLMASKPLNPSNLMLSF